MISDELLKQALSEYEEHKLSQLPAEDACEHAFSPAFEADIRRITRKKPKLTRRLSHMAACLSAVCMVSVLMTFCLSPDARATMLSWVRGTEKSYFTYRSTGGTQDNADLVYSLSDIPEGYTLFADHSEPGHGMVVYANEDGQLLSFQYTADTGESAMYLDPESAKHSTVMIGSASADLYLSTSPEKSSTIVWIDSQTDYLLTVMGFFDEEGLVKLAKNAAVVTQSK